MTTQNRMREQTPRLVWPVPAALVALSAIPLVAGALRLLQLAGGPELIPAEERFAEFPLAIALHILGAATYLLLGATQFVLLAAPAGGARPTGRRPPSLAGEPGTNVDRVCSIVCLVKGGPYPRCDRLESAWRSSVIPYNHDRSLGSGSPVRSSSAGQTCIGLSHG